ncbi:MAG: tetratricopeptide repeat protein [Verrucomicrobiales bacterium]
MSDEAAQHAFLRGTHLLEVGRHEEAAAFFRESIAHDASYAAAFANLSRCLLEIEGKKEEALGAIDGAIALEPEESYYHALRSMVLVERHKNSEALRAAQEAVRLSPGEPFTHATEARAHLAAEKWATAEICARRALYHRWRLRLCAKYPGQWRCGSKAGWRKTRSRWIGCSPTTRRMR